MRIPVALTVVVLALVIAYVLSYRRPRVGLEILQTNLEDFRFDMLLAHQPVLVAEPVARLDDVLNAWFRRWNWVGATVPGQGASRLRNASKFLVVHAAGANTKVAVELTNPAHPDTVLRVLLPPDALLLAPYLWDVAFPDGGVTLTPVDDGVTRLLRFLG